MDETEQAIQEMKMVMMVENRTSQTVAGRLYTVGDAVVEEV